MTRCVCRYYWTRDFIDPSGREYSLGRLSHAQFAYQLMDWLRELEEEIPENWEHSFNHDEDEITARDMLLRHGWIAVRSSCNFECYKLNSKTADHIFMYAKGHKCSKISVDASGVNVLYNMPPEALYEV